MEALLKNMIKSVSQTSAFKLSSPESSLDRGKTRLKDSFLFVSLGQSLLRIVCKVDVIDWSVYFSKALVEFIGTV